MKDGKLKVGDVAYLKQDTVSIAFLGGKCIPRGTKIRIEAILPAVISTIIGFIPLSGEFANMTNEGGDQGLFWIYSYKVTKEEEQ